MTVPSTTRRAGPFTGTGALVAYPFTFKVFAKQDLAVTIADSNGLETDLVLDSTFTVTLNVDQEATPGGTVNYAVGGVATALPSGYTLVVTGDGLEFEQTADLPQGGNFSPVVIENALDRAVMLLQRLWDGVRRSMRLPDTASDDVSTVLPVPTANSFIGWDSNGTALRNVDPNTLATVVAFAAWQSQAFSGDGVTTQFTLSSDPGNVNNLDVIVGAVPQRNNVDFTLSGVVLTFDVAPANGVSIFCRWGQALPEGTSTLQARLASAADGDGDAMLVVQQPFANATAETQHGVNARWLEPENFGAGGAGLTDDTEAFVKLAAAMVSQGRRHCRATGTYKIFVQGVTYSTNTLMAFTSLSGFDIDFSAATFIVDPAKNWTGTNAAFLYFTSCNDIKVSFGSITSPAVALNGTFTGLQAVALHGDCIGVDIPYIRAVNLFTPLLMADPVSTGSRGIHVGTIVASGCIYGINGADSGSDMVIDNLNTDGCGRSLFVYGVSNVKAKIKSKNHKFSADCVINAVTSGYQNIKGFRIDYTNTETTSSTGLCVIVSHSFGGGVATTITDVDVKLNVVCQGGLGSAFEYTKVDASGNPDTTDRGHTMRGMRISGQVRGTPSSGGQISLGRNVTVWGSGETIEDIDIGELSLTNSTALSIDAKRIMPALKGSFNLHQVRATNDIDLWGSGSATTYAPSSTSARVMISDVVAANIDGYNSSSGVLGLNSLPITTNTTLPVGFTGMHISNQFAAGTVIITLPASVAGLSYRFSQPVGLTMRVDPNGTEYFQGQAAGKYMALGAVGTNVAIRCRTAGVWEIESSYGSITFEP